MKSIALLALLPLVAACGRSHASSFDVESEAGAGITDASAAGDSQPFGSFGEAAPTPGNGCSADLHSILDPSGNILATCPPDEGCAAGQCVAACQAAAAAHGSIGCDFLLSTPGFDFGILPPCFAAFAANNWGTTATVEVSRGGQSLDPTTFGRIPDGTPTAASWPLLDAGGLATSGVAVLFLSSDPDSKNPQTGDAGAPLGCPVPDAVDQSTAIVDTQYGPEETYEDTGIGQAFHIVTSVPVSLYDILPYGGAASWLPSAQLVLPTTSWGKNFIVISPKECTGGTCVSSGGLQWIHAIAATDGTQIQILPTQSLPAGTGVAAAPQGSTSSYTIDAGDFIQWAYNGDLTGTVLSSDNPIAVISGALLCLNGATAPMGGGCDSAHQTMLPVDALGFEYVAQPYATRRASLQPESIPYRLVGAKDGTALTFDPPGIGPATLDLGQVVDFEATQAFTVTSQDNGHVFYMTQMATGCLVTDGSRPGITPGIDSQFGGQDCLGDEEFVDVLPPAQWLPRYVFFTDPSYATTNVTVARKSTSSGFQDVTIDCIGTVTGWQDVGVGGKYQVTNVDLERATVPVGSCTSGGHVASSSAPFGLVVWGLDEFASYAYPAGGNFSSINQVVVPVTQ